MFCALYVIFCILYSVCYVTCFVLCTLYFVSCIPCVLLVRQLRRCFCQLQSAGASSPVLKLHSAEPILVMQPTWTYLLKCIWWGNPHDLTFSNVLTWMYLMSQPLWCNQLKCICWNVFADDAIFLNVFDATLLNFICLNVSAEPTLMMQPSWMYCLECIWWGNPCDATFEMCWPKCIWWGNPHDATLKSFLLECICLNVFSVATLMLQPSKCIRVNVFAIYLVECIWWDNTDDATTTLFKLCLKSQYIRPLSSLRVIWLKAEAWEFFPHLPFSCRISWDF